ncbi:unnamed protein product [Victoria cruziana]
MASKATSTIRFNIEVFDGKMKDFNMWRLKMQSRLVQHGLSKALKGKEALPADWSETDKEDYLERALAAMHLSLSDDVLHEVADEDSPTKLWLKLEARYMTNLSQIASS